MRRLVMMLAVYVLAVGANESAMLADQKDGRLDIYFIDVRWCRDVDDYSGRRVDVD